MGKTAIVYYSMHHGNTKKILELCDVCKSAPVKIRTDGGGWENE